MNLSRNNQARRIYDLAQASHIQPSNQAKLLEDQSNNRKRLSESHQLKPEKEEEDSYSSDDERDISKGKC